LTRHQRLHYSAGSSEIENGFQFQTFTEEPEQCKPNSESARDARDGDLLLVDRYGRVTRVVRRR